MTAVPRHLIGHQATGIVDWYLINTASIGSETEKVEAMLRAKQGSHNSRVGVNCG
jgi:hypothetical protein